jgi:hypothetical protein
VHHTVPGSGGLVDASVNDDFLFGASTFFTVDGSGVEEPVLVVDIFHVEQQG